jgi:P-type E1-E2 ATPase
MNKFEAIAPKLKVLARARPDDKYLLLTGLQNLDEVVAVFGDGTNDAPAMKKADIAFSTGSGTTVALAASDVIVLDDNLAVVH